MAFDPALATLMTSTMKVRGLASMSTDGYLTAVYSATTATWACRAVAKQELVRTFAGTEELSGTVAWVRSTSTFGPSDHITIDGSTLGPLLRVEHYDDEDGHHHSKAYFGS